MDVHYLCAPGSADDIIWRTVNAKLQVVGETLDGNLAGTATGAQGSPVPACWYHQRHNLLSRVAGQCFKSGLKLCRLPVATIAAPQ